jgi:hypothetical protein
MTEGYSSVLGRQLFVWSGWVFTVGGAIGSFVLGEAHAWIGWLAVLAGLLALTGHSYSVHRRCLELEEANKKLTEQVRDAERKLNEVPLDLVNRIGELIAPHSVIDVAARLAAHADYVLRIRQFMLAASDDIHLRRFVRRDNTTYAVAKIAAAALSHLRENDLFFLVHSTEGLKTDCAVMVVHQTPEPDHDVVHFRLVNLLSDDIKALEQLAATRGEIAGLTGYTLRPACDPGWYGSLESARISEAIVRLADGLERERRGKS